MSSKLNLVAERKPKADDFTKGFAQRLRYLRQQRELTQKDLGDRVGVARSMIVNYEGGFHHPPLPTLIKLARELGVTVDDLLDERKVTENDIQDRELLEFVAKVDKLDFRIRNALKEIILGLVRNEEKVPASSGKTRAA